MNQEWKEKWVAALRSGEYKQTRHVLRNITPENEGFCCLGVLCDLWDNKAWDEVKGTGTRMSFQGWEEGIPTPVREVVGLKLHHAQELVDMNDNKGRSFGEIADHIEANL